MLAHAASAQGISAVENMCGREHVLDHNTVPAACFTHPEVSELFHSVNALISMTQRPDYVCCHDSVDVHLPSCSVIWCTPA